MIGAILFDLDGTLIDTADDLTVALNHVRQQYGKPPLPAIQLRSYASRGAGGLLEAGLNLFPEDDDFEAARESFLTHYAQHLTDHVRFFPGIESLLDVLDAQRLPWGIVTNKHMRFTTPVLAHLKLDRRAHCVVAGDTTPHPKPHPLPLLHAARQIGVAPQDCWYVGDDRRDVDAALAAQYQRSVAVRWGYLGQTPVETWGADTIIDTPDQLWPLIHSTATASPSPALP